MLSGNMQSAVTPFLSITQYYTVGKVPHVALRARCKISFAGQRAGERRGCLLPSKPSPRAETITWIRFADGRVWLGPAD
jgi:hypothetical protein